jgi:hypothetical protein
VLRIGSGKAYCMSTCLLLLKRNGIDLNAIDDDVDRLSPLLHSRTPQMIAVENRYEEVVRPLFGRQDLHPNINDT